MILQLLFLLFLLLVLFLLTRKNHNLLFLLLYLWTGSRNFAVNFLSFIFLPGTFVHEVSHWIAATILRVPAGELSIFPNIKDNGEVQAGKLEIAQTDPFRHALIGLAPRFCGLALIYILGKVFLSDFFLTGYFSFNSTRDYFLLSVICYLLFVVTSSMFSSKKDLETIVIAFPVTLLVILMLNYIGVRIFFEASFLEKTAQILTELNGYLIVCSAIDLFILIFFQINISLWQKILKKEIAVIKKN